MKLTSDVAETIDALGTLTIGDDGESKYFGMSGGSEVCTSIYHALLFIDATLFSRLYFWYGYVSTYRKLHTHTLRSGQCRARVRHS
jgi:hypothetical protein